MAHERAFPCHENGPGAGKTSHITEFARRGFHTIPECGRMIIREEMASAEETLPRTGRMAYAEWMQLIRSGS